MLLWLLASMTHTYTHIHWQKERQIRQIRGQQGRGRAAEWDDLCPPVFDDTLHTIPSYECFLGTCWSAIYLSVDTRPADVSLCLFRVLFHSFNAYPHPASQPTDRHSQPAT